MFSNTDADISKGIKKVFFLLFTLYFLWPSRHNLKIKNTGFCRKEPIGNNKKFNKST